MDSNYVYTYDAGEWSGSTTVVSALERLTSVACPARHWWVAVDDHGTSAVPDGPWSRTKADRYGDTASVSCPTVGSAHRSTSRATP